MAPRESVPEPRGPVNGEYINDEVRLHIAHNYRLALLACCRGRIFAVWRSGGPLQNYGLVGAYSNGHLSTRVLLIYSNRSVETCNLRFEGWNQVSGESGNGFVTRVCGSC